MHLNSKGEGGFTESIIAVITVVIALTVFLSFLTLSMHNDTGSEETVPVDFLDKIKIDNGKISADIVNDLDILLERYGYSAIRVDIRTLGDVLHSELVITRGTLDSDAVRSDAGTKSIESSDGRTVIVSYTVAVWK